MRKGTKKIREITIRGVKYFCFDLDPNEAGVRTRVYGRTEEELKEKIERAQKERDLRLRYARPYETDTVYEYVRFLLKNKVGKTSLENLRREASLCDSLIQNSIVDVPVPELKKDTFLRYLSDTVDMYGDQLALVVFELLRDALAFDFVKPLLSFDIAEISLPHSGPMASQYKDFISKEQLQRLVEFCITDARSFGNVEDLILFCALTGIRASEATELLIEDVAVSEEGITVKGILFPADKRALTWFSGYLLETEARKPDCDRHLFLSRDNRPVTLRAVRGTLSKIRMRVGLPIGLTPSSLHESFLCLQMEDGVSAEILSQRFGLTPAALRRYQNAKDLWLLLRKQ